MLIVRYLIVGIALLLLVSGLYLLLDASNTTYMVVGAIMIALVLYAGYTQIVWVDHGKALVVERYTWTRKVVVLKRGYHLILLPPRFDFVKKKLKLSEIPLETAIFKAATKDNVNVNLEVAVSVKIADPLKVVSSVGQYDKKTPGIVRSELRTIIKDKTAEEILRERENLSKKAKNNLTPFLKDLGIQLTQIGILNIDIPPEVEYAIQKKAQAKYEMDVKILEAETRLQLTDKEAEIERILTESIFKTINKLIEENGDNTNIPIEFLLGKNYLSVLEKMSTSKNSKLVVFPSDKQKSLKELYAASQLENSLENLGNEENSE